LLQVTVQTIKIFDHFPGIKSVSLSYLGLILVAFSQRFSGSFSERLIFRGLFPYPIHHGGRDAKFPGCYWQITCIWPEQMARCYRGQL